MWRYARRLSASGLIMPQDEVKTLDEQQLLAKLENLAEELGYEIRYEAARGRSGRCILHGRKVAVVDSNQTVKQRAAALAAILADENLDDIYVPPALRLLVESYRRGNDDDHGEDDQIPEATDNDGEDGGSG